MSDPFDALRRTDPPIAPRPAFAAELRARLDRNIRPPAPPSEEPEMSQEPTTRPGVSPYLCVDGARRALDWYVDVLDAQVAMEPIVMDDGRIGHAELAVGDSLLLVSDEFPEIGVRSPTSYGGTPVSLVVSVTDADATFAAAVERGATAERPVADQPYGGRAGWLVDPFGHRWNVHAPSD